MQKDQHDRSKRVSAFFGTTITIIIIAVLLISGAETLGLINPILSESFAKASMIR